MTSRPEFRTIIGMLIWVGIAGAGWLIVQQTWSRSEAAVAQLAEYVSNQRFVVEVKFPQPVPVRIGDPVFLPDSETYTPIGYLSRAGDAKSTTREIILTDQAEITFYANAPSIEDNDWLDYHLAGDDTAWVLKTMLPPEKRQQISELILNSYAANKTEIVEAIRPIVIASLTAAGQVVKEDLKTALAKREARFRAIGQKYQTTFVDEKLVPLIQDEVWPLVATESEPLVSEIGQEIWQEVSMFRFGWRYLYDRSPLPEQNLAGREFERFMEQKAVPILTNHVDDFVTLQQTLIEKISRNEKVRETFAGVLKEVSDDTELQTILNEIFQEVFVNNVRLIEAVETHWNSPQARSAVEQASRRLEPTITEIGVALFGSPREKITPEFARVLRHRILRKDDRWFTLQINGSVESTTMRTAKPQTLTVRIAHPAGEIPYAPSRERKPIELKPALQNFEKPGSQP